MFQNPEQAFGGALPLLELIERIYAAVQTPALWGGVMEGISAALGGESIALFAGFLDEPTPDIMALEKMPADVWADFANYYAAINPIMAGCERMFAVGTTWVSQHAMSDAELEKTEFYNDFFKPNDMHYAVGLRVPFNGTAWANLSCQRSKQLGPFATDADVVLQTLRPHLQRALLLHRQISLMQAGMLGLEAALDAAERAVIGVDAQGRVVLCNNVALTTMQQGAGLKLVQGRLCCELTEDDDALQALLRSVLLGGAGGAIQARRNGSVLHVTVSAFRGRVAGRSTPLGALVFLSDPARAAGTRSTTLRALYGLTPAEGRIADLLLQGQEVRELADTLRITVETARSHVKRVLTKTGARRQSDLVRLMLGLPVV